MITNDFDYKSYETASLQISPSQWTFACLSDLTCWPALLSWCKIQQYIFTKESQMWRSTAFKLHICNPFWFFSFAVHINWLLVRSNLVPGLIDAVKYHHWDRIIKIHTRFPPWKQPWFTHSKTGQQKREQKQNRAHRNSSTSLWKLKELLVLKKTPFFLYTKIKIFIERFCLPETNEAYC